MFEQTLLSVKQTDTKTKEKTGNLILTETKLLDNYKNK